MICLVVALSLVGSIVTRQPADIVEQARTAMEMLAKGEFAKVVERFDDKMRAALPADKLQAAWTSIESQAGKFQRLGEAQVDTKGDYRIVQFPGEFAQATVTVQFVFNASGEIAGWFVRPAP